MSLLSSPVLSEHPWSQPIAHKTPHRLTKAHVIIAMLKLSCLRGAGIEPATGHTFISGVLPRPRPFPVSTTKVFRSQGWPSPSPESCSCQLTHCVVAGVEPAAECRRLVSPHPRRRGFHAHLPHSPRTPSFRVSGCRTQQRVHRRDNRDRTAPIPAPGLAPDTLLPHVMCSHVACFAGKITCSR